MKKLIGITASPTSKNQNVINNAYFKAFNSEDTTPIIIPCLYEYKNEIITKKEQENIQKHISVFAETCDALVLSGGSDLNPTLLNQKNTDAEGFDHNRDIFEIELVKKFLELKKPILGICRGFQLLGNMLDLNYFQQDLSKTEEIHSGNQSDILNRKEPIHKVHLFGAFKEYLEKNGLTEERIAINSWHHQGFTLRPEGKRVHNADIKNFTEGKVKFHEDGEKKILVKSKPDTKEDPINNFEHLNIIMCTNHVIEGFQHKTLPILAFQNHPEEYTESLAIRYFIKNYLNAK